MSVSIVMFDKVGRKVVVMFMVAWMVKIPMHKMVRRQIDDHHTVRIILGTPIPPPRVRVPTRVGFPPWVAVPIGIWVKVIVVVVH